MSGLRAAAAASNKICNKYHLLHLVGILFPYINEDARSESLQILPSVQKPFDLQLLGTLLLTFQSPGAGEMY